MQKLISSDCGTCDICRNMPVKSLSDEMAEYINVSLRGTYSIEDVERRFGAAVSSSSDHYLKVLRHLIDKGTVPSPIVK